MLDMGMRVTIDTDNMILSDIDLEREYAHCLNEMGFTMEDLKTCSRYAIEAAFLPQEEKDKLLAQLR